MFNLGAITVGSDSDRQTSRRDFTFLAEKLVGTGCTDHSFAQGATIVTNAYVQTDMKVCKATKGIIEEPGNIALKVLISTVNVDSKFHTFVYCRCCTRGHS